MVIIQASKSPFRDDWVYAEVAGGQTIDEIVGGSPVHAWIDGHEVPAMLLKRARIKDGVKVVVRPVPQDDDIKRGILIIAAIAAGAYVTGAMKAAEYGAFASYFTGAATTALLTQGAYSLFPIEQPDNEVDPFNRLPSLTGASNEIAWFSPIPRVYGTFRWFPPIPMSGRPFTEILGGEQYLRMFLVLGYGPLEIGGIEVGEGRAKIDQNSSIGDAVKIGDTDIHFYEGVEFEIGRHDQMTLYKNTVIENNPGWTTSHPLESGGGSGWFTDGDSFVQTTDTGATEISIDVHARLFSVNSKGKTKYAIIEWKIEYAPTGTGSWVVVQDPWVMRSNKKETHRQGFKWDVAEGQYDVRLTRIRTFHPDLEATANEATWVALRTIREGTKPFAVDGMITMDLRIKATDQLNGRLNNLSVLTTSVLQVWNGSAWVEQPTNVPAWIYADIWAGSANRRPVDRALLDVDELTAWANETAANGRTYNRVINDDGTTFRRTKEVASVGRASWAVTPDAKISVIREIFPSEPKMVISPRNAFGFSYEQATLSIPHAFRVQFVNSENWEDTERLVFDDGFDETNATLYEVLRVQGVTDPDQAWKHGRYNLAQAKLRPEIYSFQQDVQHLRYKRGDLLTLAHDVIKVGIGWGRIKSVTKDKDGNIVSFVSDEFLQMADSGASYGAKIQRNDGSVVVVRLQNDNPGTTNATLSPPSAEVFEAGNHFVFGLADQESIDVKPVTIEPEEEFTVRVSCVPASPGIVDAETGEIPAFDPVLTGRVDPAEVELPIPRIDSVISDENVLLPDNDGSLRVRMVVETSVASFPGWNSGRQARFRVQDTEPWELTEVTTKDNISIVDVSQDVAYEIQVRSVREFRVSDWSATTTHTVVGKSTPPQDVVNLAASTSNWISGGSKSYGIRLTWDDIASPDLDRYEVRDDQNFGLEGTHLLARPKDNQVNLPIAAAGSYTFYVKARDSDVDPNYSVNVASVAITISPPAQPTIAQRFSGADFVLSWAGGEDTDFPIAYYDVRRGGTSFGDATQVDTLQARELRILADWLGSETWRVAAVDVAGNVGAAASTTVSINASAEVPNLTTKVLSLDVLLNWDAARATLPTDHYNIYRNTAETAQFTDAGTQLVTTVDGTFAAIKEDVADEIAYWVAPVDTAGNEGAEKKVTVTVQDPSDLVVQSRFESDFSAGTATDMVQNTSGTNQLLGPYDVSNTVDDHYTGYSTTDDIINDGFTYVLQPTRVTAGQYQEEFDLGAVLTQTSITVSYNRQDLDGNPSVAVTIEGKELSGDPYTVLSNSKNAFANNVQFIRVTIDVTADTDDDLLSISSLEVTAKVTEATSQDTVSVVSTDTDTPLGGTLVTLDRPYLDIQSVSASVKGDNPQYTAFADWEDAQGQNEIHLWAYDNNGNRASVDVSYVVRGVIQ